MCATGSAFGLRRCRFLPVQTSGWFNFEVQPMSNLSSLSRKMMAVGGLGLFLAMASAPVFAESEYEYAKMLMDRNVGSFSTEDLIERFVTQLAKDPATQTDAKLIQATFRCHQADKATLDKRLKLLGDAQKLFN